MAAGQGKMVAIAIFSADPAMRRSLEQLLRADSALSIIGVVDDPTAFSLLIDQNHVNVVLADVPPLKRLADWRIRHNQTAFVIFVDGADEDGSLDALYAGARAILPRTAKSDVPTALPSCRVSSFRRCSAGPRLSVSYSTTRTQTAYG
jgi:DNA-binding NarL/FixJ family response regulator